MKRTLTKTARKLRRRQTEAEKLLWNLLRNRNLGGIKFRRQFQVGGYITDFACSERKIVIELDGGQHAGCLKDAERDVFIKNKGYRIFRFWDNEFLTNKDGVLEKILNECNTPSPLPSPPRGEGKKEKQRVDED